MTAETDIVVTDHAVLRYLERGHGIDVEYFRDHLAQLARRGADAGATGRDHRERETRS